MLLHHMLYYVDCFGIRLLHCGLVVSDDRHWVGTSGHSRPPVRSSSCFRPRRLGIVLSPFAASRVKVVRAHIAAVHSSVYGTTTFRRHAAHACNGTACVSSCYICAVNFSDWVRCCLLSVYGRDTSIHRSCRPHVVVGMRHPRRIGDGGPADDGW